MSEVWKIVGFGALAVAGLLLLIFLALFMRYINLWISSVTTGAGIGPIKLVSMSLKKINPRVIVRAKIMSVQAGLPNVTTNNLEAHYLAGGNVLRVVQSLIAATRARLGLNWDTASAIDLAGRDVLDAPGPAKVDPLMIRLSGSVEATLARRSQRTSDPKR